MNIIISSFKVTLFHFVACVRIFFSLAFQLNFSSVSEIDIHKSILLILFGSPWMINTYTQTVCLTLEDWWLYSNRQRRFRSTIVFFSFIEIVQSAKRAANFTYIFVVCFKHVIFCMKLNFHSLFCYYMFKSEKSSNKSSSKCWLVSRLSISSFSIHFCPALHSLWMADAFASVK